MLSFNPEPFYKKKNHWNAFLLVRVFFVILTMITLGARADVLTVTKSSHPLDQYAIDVLELALKHMDRKYTLEVVEGKFTQSRVVEDVKSGKVDVFWLATDKKSEQLLHPIRFPIIKGLLGHRVFIIHPDMQKKFDQVRTFDDLKEFTFGQGAGWPDVGILKSNDLDVVVTSKYENLFHMVEGGRFDGFPRGVLEPWVELHAHPELDLVVESSLVLVYRMPFYFYVSEENKTLARQLHNALDAALADGSFDKYFYSNPMIKDAINRSNLKNRKAFYLDNPNISKETPLERKEYWLDLNSLK